MTKRDLFRILIKLVGIYGIILVIISLSKNLGYTGALGFDSFLFALTIVLFSLAALAIMVFITLKPDSIINLLKLDKGYDDNQFNINLNLTSLVSLIIIFTACFLFINNIGLLVNNIIFDVYATQNYFAKGDSTSWFVYPLINLIISIVLIFNYRRIADYIVEKGAKQSTDTTDKLQ